MKGYLYGIGMKLLELEREQREMEKKLEKMGEATEIQEAVVNPL